MTKRRTLLPAAAALLGVAGIYVLLQFRSDISHQRQRVAEGSQLIQSRYGPLEYAIAGTGPPLLMIHGTGGGFDQGLAFSEAIIRNDIRVIAPSRFGYLRSSWPDDPSSERQADAFVDLLDRLKLRKVAVAGARPARCPPSSSRFAIRSGRAR